MLYTKKGDGGTSKLYNSERLQKTALIFEVLGTCDELNCALGMARAEATSSTRGAIAKKIRVSQEYLFMLQSELAGAEPKITNQHVTALESAIQAIEEIIPPIRSFTVPGETHLEAKLDFSRAVSRRLERLLLRYHATYPIGEPARIFINRLSSYLFALARFAAHEEGAIELRPLYSSAHETV